MDITLCTNTTCSLKEQCKRAEKQNLQIIRQSYALFKPKLNEKTDKWECEFLLKK